MLKNRAVRLQALILANSKVPKEQRRQLADLQGLVDVIEPMSRVASPRGFAVKKAGGGSRPVFSFGLEDRACAVLIREALKPFARAHPQAACHPAQVLLSGGLPAACEHLRRALEEAPTGAVFLQIDAKRFFPSMACEGLAKMTRLPPEVIHRHLSVKHMEVRGKASLKNALRVMGEDQRDMTSEPSGADREKGSSVLSGIATGSAAASIVAEMVMGHILRDAGSLQGLIALIVYSDNIGVLVRSREEALAVQEAVLGAFSRSRAGPFSPSKVSIKDVATGFNFLGYWWRRQEGRIHAEPSRLRHEWWEMDFGNRLLFALSADDVGAFDYLQEKLQGYANSKNEWAGRAEFEAGWEARIASYRVFVSERISARPAEGGVSLRPQIGAQCDAPLAT
nr:reverse transcriptase domain-containing protein [uncultured Brevundimonas sp.]